MKNNEREKEKQSQEANPRKVTSCNRNPESQDTFFQAHCQHRKGSVMMLDMIFNIVQVVLNLAIIVLLVRRK